jgi:hypothetical protein
MLFFGTGTGRCGTMTLANLLNEEAKTVCLHEGKFRHGETAGEQWLPFLTLQNLHGYFHPERNVDVLHQTRGEVEARRTAAGLDRLGDIAYNYAPFVGQLPQVFPTSRLFVMVRDGRDFVRSVYTSEVPDPTPVGWPDADRKLDKVERYIALGRLRPRPGDPLAKTWDKLPPVGKNAWLWAETNRLILDGLAAWPTDQVRVLRFETFFADPLGNYDQLRAFLGIDRPLPASVPGLLEKRINARRQTILPHWREWDAAATALFEQYAGAMMRRLGYH